MGEPINEVLRITEGHDELIFEDGAFGAWNSSPREGGLDGCWLPLPFGGGTFSPRVQRPSPHLRDPNATFFLRQVPDASPSLVFHVGLRKPQQGRHLCTQAFRRAWRS